MALLTQCWILKCGRNGVERVSLLNILQNLQFPQQRIRLMLHRQGWLLWKQLWPSRHRAPAHLALTCERYLDTRVPTLVELNVPYLRYYLTRWSCYTSPAARPHHSPRLKLPWGAHGVLIELSVLVVKPIISTRTVAATSPPVKSLFHAI